MPTSRYTKAPSLNGRVATIMVGRGNMTIRDGMILEGEGFEVFVKHGILVRLPDPPVELPSPCVPPPVEPDDAVHVSEPVAEPVADQEGDGVSEIRASDLLRKFRESIPTPRETPVPVSVDGQDVSSDVPGAGKRGRRRPRK